LVAAAAAAVGSSFSAMEVPAASCSGVGSFAADSDNRAFALDAATTAVALRPRWCTRRNAAMPLLRPACAAEGAPCAALRKAAGCAGLFWGRWPRAAPPSRQPAERR